MMRVLRGLGLVVVGVSLAASASGLEPAQGVSGRVVRVAQKKTVRKKATATPSAPAEAATAPAESNPAPASSDGVLKFSRDIAPILVHNCAECHIRPAKKKGDFDMTTFEKLMVGAKKEKVIVPGNPDESHLVLRIRGEETPKMPQGGNRNLSDEAIARIEQWVKAGALLDAGKDPKAPIESYASSPEDIRKAQLAKMTAEQRDKQVETVGRERWKKASPKAPPEVATGKHFLLFSTLPKARAGSTLKKLDDEFDAVQSLLGRDALDWGEKGSVFVFNDVGSYGEFVTAFEQREVEPGDTGTGRFRVPQPYVAVVDPLGGRDAPEPASSLVARKPARARRGRAAAGAEANLGGAERTLLGLLTEHFVSGAASRAGKPPRWVTLGLGALVAKSVEPGSPYYRKIQRDALEVCNLGWQSKATNALGDQEKTEVVRAVGFAVLDSVSYSYGPAALSTFVKAMNAGGDKLDDAVGNVLNLSRQDFLSGSGQFVMTRYGR